MTRYSVFFLDDEKVTIRPYIDFLEAHNGGWCEFRIIVQDAIFQAHQYIVTSIGAIDAMILDLQMPWEDKKWIEAGIEISRAEKDKFIYPGLWFLNRFRDEVIERKIPVFILTNMRLDEVERVLEEINIPNPLQVEFARKIDTPAIDFPERLSGLIQRNIQEL